MAMVYVPAPLRRVTGGQGTVSAAGKNVREVLEALDRQFPGFRRELYDEAGEVRSFINVFVNGVEIRTLQGLNTPVREADEVSIIPAMAGGS